MNEPVVVEFISLNDSSKHYYIGKSEKDILESTNKGKEDYLAKFSSYRKVPKIELKKLNLSFYKDGYEAILNGTNSYKLKTPDNNS